MPPWGQKLSVVYYFFTIDVPAIYCTGDAIKIGWSADLHTRRRTLERTHGSLLLAAWELGDRNFEQQRHRQFGDSIIDLRYEWFRPSDPLMQHIRTLRAGQHGLLCGVTGSSASTEVERRD